jgi:hypothetical protein
MQRAVQAVTKEVTQATQALILLAVLVVEVQQALIQLLV